jgi:hypothetical protein
MNPFRSLVAVLLPVLSWSLSTDEMVGVPFGTLHLQLRSQVESSVNDVLFHVLSQTGIFLDNHLLEKYNGSFSHVTLAIDAFALTESPTIHVNTSASTEDKVLSYAENYDVTLDLLGTALFFPHTRMPWKSQLIAQVTSIFKNNAVEYANVLSQANNDLLQDLRFAIVTVHGETVNVPGNGNMTTTGTTTSTGSSTPSSSSSSTMEMMPSWVIPVLAGVGSAFLVFVICVACKLICSRQLNRSAPTQKFSAETAEDDNDEEAMLSPMQSEIGSVGSSVYTYNPAHLYSNNNSNNNSKAHMLFGNDISAIANRRDLSLIEEQSLEDLGSEPSTPGRDRSRPPPRSSIDSATGDLTNAVIPTDSIRIIGMSRVIEDLNDLSAQIDTHRRTSREFS